VRLDLLDGFDERVRANADAMAVEAPDVEITHCAASRRADVVARALLDAGRWPAARVAAWTGDRAAPIGVTLGVLRAGTPSSPPLEHDAPDEGCVSGFGYCGRRCWFTTRPRRTRPTDTAPIRPPGGRSLA
jgi:hypothetical protein